MEHPSNNHEDHPNQHKNSHRICAEMGHPILSLTKSQRKLRQQHDPNFQILVSEERNKSKRAGL